MKRIDYIIALSCLSLSPLILSSCDEDVDKGMFGGDDRISFIAGVPGVSTRTNYDVSAKIISSGITVSAFSTEADDDQALLHFEDRIVEREVDGLFRSTHCRWPGNRDEKTGYLKFFAFHPSIKAMRDSAGVGKECFIYSNLTERDESGISYDYRLTKFRVAPDISKQVDFVTAHGEGNKTEDLYSYVQLDFEHQLSGVEIGVWGASTLYDVEVAGVRIGGIVVEADFGLSTVVENPAKNENTIGEWFISQSPKRGYVDYVFTPGDKVVVINANEHNTREKATSIMGANGGNAMVIPYKYDKWDYVNDKENKRGIYFSALIRMTQRDGDNHMIFPSTDPKSQDYIVYLSVRKSDGEVMKRLDKYGNVYGTSTHYDIPPTEELRHYGWAAVPAKVDWKAGYTYHYIMDYTNGVGVHDPNDSNPAIPILDWGGVEISTTTGNWSSGGVVGGVVGSDGSSGSWGAYNNNTAPDGTVWWK